MDSPSLVSIGLIVEGHAEEQAVPALIRRIARELEPPVYPKCETRRVSKSELIRPGGLERAVEALTRQIGRSQPILVLMDADEDCPKTLAPNLMTRCAISHADLKISIVMANKEYEAWFLAAARSLAGHRGLAAQMSPPDHPESIPGAKEWLTHHMPPHQSYSPTRHQAAFSERMDISEARTARSFRKFEEAVCGLLQSAFH